MRKFSWMLLVLLAFSVYAEDEDLLVVGSAKELKGITAKKIIWKKDGAKMVVIPANSSGTRTTVVEANYDNFGDLVTSKKKLIVRATDAFYMDAYEVTVGQFKKFLKASGYKPDYPINWNQVYEYSPTEKHPMIYVTWHDATAYAKWAGKRLPTKIEWEWAARGGLIDKEYPWGNDETEAENYANSDGIDGKDKWKYCAPVGSFKPNRYGLFDMAGNVWEWCQDWYDSDEDSRVLQGGSCLSNTPDLRVVPRLSGLHPTSRYNFNGVRCVSGLN